MNPALLSRSGATANFTFHPATDLFPEMEVAAFEALVADIARNGQQEPIVIQDSQVIDGRHRLRACHRLGIEPRIREVHPDVGDPTALIISLNLHRRHLSDSQRAMVAARLETLAQGQRAASARDANLHVCTRDEAAQKLAVSPRSVANAAKVQADGVPELVAAVDRGDVAVSTAAALARLPADTQRQVLSRTPEEINTIASDVRSRIQEAGVVGPSAVRIFDKVAREKGLSATEQCAVVEVLKADSPALPTPAEARRIALEGEPGLMVLGSDNRYHTAPGDPEENARIERWLVLREGLERLGTLPFQAAEAFASIPAYQKQNVTAWLAHAVPFLNQLNTLWSQHHA